MAKKNLAGQINMFDFFRDLEKNAEASGKVEMVSLMPESELAAEGETESEDEETTHKKHEVGLEIVDKKAQHGKNDKELKSEKINSSETKNVSNVAMHREKRDADGNIVAEISYINYNKVLIRRKGHEDIIKLFDNSYDAVDYYVSNMRLDNF